MKNICNKHFVCCVKKACSVVASVTAICVFLLFVGLFFEVGNGANLFGRSLLVASATGIPGVEVSEAGSDTEVNNSAYQIRFIDKYNLDTLMANSKWGTDPLKTVLEDALNNDLTDTSSCQQVWFFEDKDFLTVQKWCLEQDKGTETNKNFVLKFATTNKIV